MAFISKFLVRRGDGSVVLSVITTSDDTRQEKAPKTWRAPSRGPFMLADRIVVRDPVAPAAGLG